MRGTARGGEPPGDEPDPAPEVVGRAEVDEPLLDRRFAEEHRRDGLLAGALPHARRDEAVEPRERVLGAAPGDRDLAIGGRKPRRRLRERPVLHDEPAGEDGREHRRAGDDADRDEDEPVAARREPGADEAQWVADPVDPGHQ